MAKLPRHLLERSPEETARRLCLRLLDEAAKALERMNVPEDKEGLHDFRVSLRRLRSLMRAYRRPLKGSRGKRMRSRVKALASSTNLARDTEVQIDWLSEQSERLGEPARSGAAHLITVLQSRRETVPTAAALGRELRALRRDLTKALRRMRLGAEDASQNYVQATASIVGEHAEVLRASLDAAHTAEDADSLHRARIEAKRLRYILEPLQGELADARPLIKGMKSLQDCLGDLQDTRVLTELVSDELESSALEAARKLRDLALREAELPEAYPPQNPGLLALLREQRTRRDRRFADLTTEWTGDAGRAYFARIDRFLERLRVWPDGELPKRRFLLAGVPAELRRQKGELVREGWLPGRLIRESVRATRQGRRVRYERVVHYDDTRDTNGRRPRGEPISRAVFDGLWALTEGRRLEYRRFELVAEERTWTILSIPEKTLVLASVEGGVDAAIPELIQSELTREVTGVKKYEWEALARSRPRPIPQPAD